MHIEKVILSNFRNYERQEITFSQTLNCIQGDNAQGKSNLLEALYLISTGKSFRTSQLSQLIRYDQNQFQIEVHFMKEGMPESLTLSYGVQGRKLLYNQTPYSSFLPLLGILPCVLLVPEDISILTGSPSERRRFLDLHISQMDPLYVHHLGRYHKAMKQRNALLKIKAEKGIEPWEQIMAISASYLIEKRKEALAALENDIGKTISLLSETKESFSWSYQSSLQETNSEKILEEWAKNRKKDLLLGTTLTGPHRDDLLLFIENQEVKIYCSEGQKRSCLTALRLAEWNRFKTFFGYCPLFGIDDFGVHLDDKRTHLLRNSLHHLGQTFLTAPSFSHLEKGFILQITEGALT